MKKIPFFLFFGLLMACEVLDSAPDIKPDEPILIIEGLLTNENIRHQVKLSSSFSSLDQQAVPIQNARVFLNDGENTVRLRRVFESPGVYQLPFPVRAVVNRTYRLSVLYADQTYSAFAQADFLSPLQPPKVEINEEGLFQFEYQDSPEPSMTEVNVFFNDEEGTQHLRSYYYTLNVIDVNSIIPPEKEELSFPPGSILVRKKYSLSPQHQEFARSFLSEVDWRGGLFDVTPGNVITNFSGGALGFFGVSMVDVDTTIVN